MAIHAGTLRPPRGANKRRKPAGSLRHGIWDFRFRILKKESPQGFGAAAGGVAIADGHAAAVVRHDDEQIGAGLGAPAAPERLDQTQHEDEDAQRLEREGDRPNPKSEV